MRICIINGPNLNLLGNREPSVYGSQSMEDYLEFLKSEFPESELECLQSNVEGELINFLQKSEGHCDGVVLNAGGYTHTSVAIGDTIAAIGIPVVEVHISNVYARESYRHVSLMAKHCKGVIAGFGMESYRLALKALIA